MTLAYLVTKEVLIKVNNGQGKNIQSFQISPGTMYIPSAELQLVCQSEDGMLNIKYNPFNDFPAECSPKLELDVLLEYGPAGSFQKIEVEKSLIESAKTIYNKFCVDLGEKVHQLFHSRQE